jgi:hypothetical protein
LNDFEVQMSYSQAVLQQIWGKGRTVGNNDPGLWRQDTCGAWIGWNYYGKHDSEYGWDVDHIKPVAQGGSDDISNLQPLQHQNNAAKGMGRSGCSVIASGAHNVAV